VSYIDTFDHEFVGYFAGVYVYHPLETVPADADDPQYFGCSPENLVIGGGPGEHPGLVVKDPEEAVASYICARLRWQERHDPEEHRALRRAIEAWSDVTVDRDAVEYWQRVFEFAGWREADYADFSQRCASGAMPRPFDPNEDGCLERWLAASIGEFVLLAMPELAPRAIERLGDLRTHIQQALYENLLLLPPGYRVWGRRVVDHQLTWGISAWQIRRTELASPPAATQGGKE
jgi:hypothetical protein